MSYQEWVVRLPIKYHGWGFRSLEEICGPAYIGALETAIPFMAARDRLCPERETEWGGEECWSEGASTDNRWRVLLNSGCQEGVEMRRTWDRLEGEARGAAQWQGSEMEPIFVSNLQGLGAGSVSGGTRGELVEAIDRIRSGLLSQALGLHRPKKDRHAWAWRQRDKLSTAWLLALPGGSDYLNNEEFSTAAATNLCLPIPACVERLGETIKGRVKVDQHGDNVQSTALPGDHWRKRHDFMKITMYRLCQWSGMPAEMEVFNIFSRFIPQEGLARFESARQRQGLIPDMRVVYQVGGQPRPVLQEIKVISSSQSRYKPSWEDRGVDVRAGHLHQEYVDKARLVD